jgi:predicted RNA-binding Zn-ribbon protein involved in translation (DUF1610 family)
MQNIIAELIGLAKQVPETEFDEAAEALREIIEKSNKARRAKVPKCPSCGADSVVRNGHKHGKQAYLCKACGTSFVETTGPEFPGIIQNQRQEARNIWVPTHPNPRKRSGPRTGIAWSKAAFSP